MSTATATVAKVDELQVKVDTFVMPKPMPGQNVYWYRHGSKSDKVEIATVLASNHRGATIKTAVGLVRQPVRHIDDPKLQLSEDQRENGAWDFTELDKQTAATIAELKAGLADLRKLITEPAPKKDK